MLTLRKLWLLWLAVLAACSSLPPDPPPVVECPPPPPVVELTEGWQFATDSDDAGLSEAWYAPETNRDGWTEQPIGRAWEQSGQPIDGIAWYAPRDRLGRPNCLLIPGRRRRQCHHLGRWR